MTFLISLLLLAMAVRSTDQLPAGIKKDKMAPPPPPHYSSFNHELEAAAHVEDLDYEHLKKMDHVKTTLDYIKSLPQVKIGNQSRLESKVRQMALGGRQKLLVISDFDFTLSRFANAAGERLSTTHGVFDDNAARIDPELGQKFVDLRNKYYPIEFDPKLTVEEKTPHMETWWNTSHGYIIKSGFTRPMIEDFVRKSRVVLRDGAADLIKTLDTKEVPLVIFSAGIGNVIEIFLEQQFGKVPANTHFISNMIQFDKDNKAVAFSEPLIHTFCKNSSVIKKEASFFHDVVGRVNVILLGDSMGDIHMDVGVEKEGPTLKIGFYNGDVKDEDLLGHYVEEYDIAIVHDPTVTVPRRIVDLICEPTALV